MKYLDNIGANSKKAFIELGKVSQKKIDSALESFNKSLLKNKSKIYHKK